MRADHLFKLGIPSHVVRRVDKLVTSLVLLVLRDCYVRVGSLTLGAVSSHMRLYWRSHVDIDRDAVNNVW